MIVVRPMVEWESAKREEEAPRLKAIESERKSQEARIKSLRNQYGRSEQSELDKQPPAINFQYRNADARLPVLHEVMV